MSHTMKRRVTVLATTISVLLIAGVVFAAWTAMADGSGSATALDVTDTSEIDFSNVGGLYPGHTETGTITITNKEAFPVVVTDIDTVDADAAIGECAAADITATPAAPKSTVLETGESDTYVVSVSMDEDAHQDCAGQDFDFTLSATLASVPDSSN